MLIEDTFRLLDCSRGTITLPPGTIDVMLSVESAEQPIVFVTDNSPTTVSGAGAPELMLESPTSVEKVEGVTEEPPPGAAPLIEDTFSEDTFTGDSIRIGFPYGSQIPLPPGEEPICRPFPG